MHVYTATCGPKDNVDKYIRELQAIKFKYTKQWLVPLMVRPVQFWEFAFPKEHFEMMMGTFCQGFNNTEERNREMKILEKFRFFLKAKKIPKMECKQRFPIFNEGVRVYPFAVKEDKVWTKEDTDALQRYGEDAIGKEQL